MRLKIVVFITMLIVMFCSFGNIVYANGINCDEEQKAVDDAEKARDEAKEKRDTARSIFWTMVALHPFTSGPDMGIWNEVRSDREWSETQWEYHRSERILREAEDALKKAKEKLDECKKRCPACGQIPKHTLHATCWNDGCNAANVRLCTHDCSYAPEVCANRISGNYCNEEGWGELPYGAKGHYRHQRYHSICRSTYFRCDTADKNKHTQWLNCKRVRYVNGVRQVCNGLYRACYSPTGKCFGGAGPSNGKHI